MALAVAATMTACNSSDDENQSESPVKMTFSIQGDFELNTHGFTRALEADGKTMTDVWVLDYVGTSLQQTIHQTSDDDDFGTPTLSLAIGTHHLYFIASRSQNPTLNTDAHTLSFSKVLDTFYKDYELTIAAGTSSGSRAVALDRIVTKLKLVFSDAIPEGAASFSVTPTTWHYGFNYMTSAPTATASSQSVAITIPSSSIGKTGESLNVFGFSAATEWSTDVAISCKTSDNSVLGSATIAAAPFQRNRVSEYTGPLFGDNGSMTLSLNADWNTSYTGTW